jgi:hypothetical protein
MITIVYQTNTGMYCLSIFYLPMYLHSQAIYSSLNNNLQNITQKTKDRATRIQQKSLADTCVPEECADPALLVAHFLLLLLHTQW